MDSGSRAEQMNEKYIYVYNLTSTYNLYIVNLDESGSDPDWDILEGQS